MKRHMNPSPTLKASQDRQVLTRLKRLKAFVVNHAHQQGGGAARPRIKGIINALNRNKL
jgi:hypothetical protein